MQDIALISRKIYTAGTNFTRLPVVTVATILNSGFHQSAANQVNLCNLCEHWATLLLLSFTLYFLLFFRMVDIFFNQSLESQLFFICQPLLV